MAISTIKDIYKKDISHKVKGVIMAEQWDDKTVYEELEEFVITRELNKHITKFFEAYNDVNENKKDTIWVWISWFFGSWKSHLLKILSYLLENREVKWKTPLEFFNEKLGDEPLLIWDITRAIWNSNIDVMLFNIDSRAWKNSKNNKDGILEVFVKVFNEKLGYCSDIPWLADFEHTLFMKGDYEKFKTKFKEISGEDWDSIKDNFYFERENVIKALSEWHIMSENDANHWFDGDWANYDMSVKKFAEIIRKYCEKIGNDHKVIFLVDEIGQYIWDSTNLMLNLQTLVEDLWKELTWQAWVMVTSQEAIDSITEIKWKDFSKIQWRFPTKLILSSANTDEVIKKRLLEKTPDAKEELEALYIKKETIIKNLISFSSATADMKIFKNKEDFSDTYPFVPYQFNLLQKVFEKIRQIWVAWSHIADWNRSMLNWYQEAWSSILDDKIWTIVPFSSFYNTIETFIWNQIKTTIVQAEDNGVLEKQDIEVLKVLFMIRHVKEIPCDLENITTLLVSDIDEDKQVLRDNIKASLSRLISQTLIHKNGDEYLFLTNEEQDINKQINAEEIDRADLLRHIWDVVFNGFYKQKKYSYSSHNNYNYNQLIDDYEYENTRQYGLVLKISTSYSDTNSESLFYNKDYAIWDIRLEDDTDLYENLRNLKKIEKWIKKNSWNDASDTVKLIINNKSKEIDEIKARIRKLLEENLKNWVVSINWKKVDDIKWTWTVINMFNDILNRLFISVYKNVDWVTKHYTEDEIIKILKSNTIEEQILIEVEDNKNSIEEIRSYINTQSDRSIKTSLKIIIEKYTSIPYGWSETDIAWIVAHLFVTWDIQLKYNEEVLHKWNSYIIDYLIKGREHEKLIVSTKKQTDKKILLTVKSIIGENFDRTDLPENEDDLYEKVKSIFREEAKKLADFSFKYQVTKYPVRMIFEISNDTITKFINIPDNTSFFNYIIQEKEEIEDLEGNITTITQFFDSQENIYTESKEKIDFYKSELDLFLPEEKEKIDLEKLEEIKNILSSSSPYSQIKDLPTLFIDIKNWYNEVLESKRSRIIDRLDSIISNVDDEIKKNSLWNDFEKRILSGFDQLKTTINNTKSCKDLMALSSSISDKNRSSNNAITNEINRIINEKKLLDSMRIEWDEKVEEKKKQVTLDIDCFVEKWVTIKTTNDIDKYTEELNKKLKEKLSAGDNIRII